MLPEEQLMRGQPVLLADSEDLWDEQYQMEVSDICILLIDVTDLNILNYNVSCSIANAVGLRCYQ